ncbi:hypothetical protein PHEL85_2884 [Polaribacter sp. Hel1_85]|nr:hypothetical protein PHEL85_2884 [Polaribacter sp. Hel1_85]
MAHGDIELAKNLSSGTYYIQLDTHWNKNFMEKYVLPIQIINPKINVVTAKNSVAKNADNLNLNFYPESGTLLNNTVNWVYLNLENNGVFIAEQPITILDNKTNKIVAKAKTNKNGQAKFSLLSKPMHNYTASLNYKNNTYTFDLDPAKDSGVIIHKKHNQENNITQNFVVEFTKDVLKTYNEQSFFATIHRNNKLLYVLPFKINKKDTKYLLAFNKENLFNGFNTLTLFNKENKPISGRHFYSETKSKINIIAEHGEITKDSLTIDFYLKSSLKNTNLSISVLPKDTKLNNNAINILDAFLLAPYINKNVAATHKMSNNDLDMLLQTQLSSFKSHHINNKKPIFAPETGLQINGTINAEIKENYKVLLSSNESEILEVTKIKPDKKFSFSNLILKDNSNYKLALLNEKGLLLKSGFYIYKQNQSYKVDSLLSYKKDEFISAKKENVETNIDYNFLEYKDAQKLDEVIVTAQIKKEGTVPESLYPNTPGLLGSGFTKKLRISEVQSLTLTVVQYLDRQVNIDAKEKFGSVYLRIKRGVSTFYGSSMPLLLIDGFPTTNLDLLYQMRLNQIASIAVNASGAGYGMRGGAGVISIDLKKGNEKNKLKTNHNYFTSETDLGFTTSKPFFGNYPFQFSSLISQQFYETLDWIPYFNILPNKTNSLKVYKGKHDIIKLFINGMNDNGNLFYDIIELSTKDRL